MIETDSKLFVTQNIKIIEMLKSQLLGHIADLYANMNDEGESFEKRIEIFVNLIIINYALAAKLGISPSVLDINVIKKLKIGALDNNNVIYGEVIELLRHLKNRC